MDLREGVAGATFALALVAAIVTTTTRALACLDTYALGLSFGGADLVPPSLEYQSVAM